MAAISPVIILQPRRLLCSCFLSLNRPPCIQPHSASLAIQPSRLSRWRLHPRSHSSKCTRQVHSLSCLPICSCIRFTHTAASRAQAVDHFRFTFPTFRPHGEAILLQSHNRNTIPVESLIYRLTVLCGVDEKVEKTMCVGVFFKLM